MIENQLDNEILHEIKQTVQHDLESGDAEHVAIVIPPNGGIGWSDYVMSKFEDDEVVVVKDKAGNEKRYPKVHGLRRLSKELLGEIVKSYPTPVSVQVGENYASATYLYHISFKDSDGVLKEFGEVGEVLYFEGDSAINNIGNVNFAKFPSAVAATRAEARTLRKALSLNVVAWEEFDKRDLQNNGNSNDSIKEELITKEQQNFISILCKNCKIDVNKFINRGGRRDGKSIYRYDSLDKISYFDATDMIKQLNEFKKEKSVQLPKYIETYKVSI